MTVVDTDLGRGEIKDHQIVRGTREFLVEGMSFSKWYTERDLLKHATPGEDGITLPYNPEPQNPVELYRNEGTILPGEERNEFDVEESLQPTDSVTLEKKSLPELTEPFSKGASFDPYEMLRITAHVIESDLDPRVGELMDLVESNKQVRESAWRDVRTKALRLRREGKVRVKTANPEAIYASVEGDHGTYDVIIIRGNVFDLGGQSVTEWSCGCDWGKWAFKRRVSYVGRFCSHGYATYLEMQSNANKGRKQWKRKKSDRESLGSEDQWYQSLYGFKNEADALRLKPNRLSPDFIFNDTEEDHFFEDVEEDTRITTGPGQTTVEIEHLSSRQAGRWDDDWSEDPYRHENNEPSFAPGTAQGPTFDQFDRGEYPSHLQGDELSSYIDRYRSLSEDDTHTEDEYKKNYPWRDEAPSWMRGSSRRVAFDPKYLTQHGSGDWEYYNPDDMYHPNARSTDYYGDGLHQVHIWPSSEDTAQPEVFESVPPDEVPGLIQDTVENRRFSNRRTSNPVYPHTETFHGSGPVEKEFFESSEDYVKTHELQHRVKIDDGDPNEAITKYTEDDPQQFKESALMRFFTAGEAHDVYDDFMRAIQDGDSDRADILKQRAQELGTYDDYTNSVVWPGSGRYAADTASPRRIAKVAGRQYSLAQQEALINERHQLGARNLDELDLEGTHYLG